LHWVCTVNKENIIPWVKGQSGNPKGKIKGTRSFKSILNNYLDKTLKSKDPFEGKTADIPARDIMMLKLIGEGLKGNLTAIRYVCDMIDGPIKQVLDVNQNTEDIDAKIKALKRKLNANDEKPTRKKKQ
jgi:hypothetical protein